jgi:hypothetical protein
MPIFSPPVLNDSPRVLSGTGGVERRLFRYFGPNPRGLAVVKVSGHYTTVDDPYQGILIGADGTDWFLGGHIYTVSAAVAAGLAADGYTTTADPTPPARNLAWGALGGGSWHDFLVNYGTWG